MYCSFLSLPTSNNLIDKTTKHLLPHFNESIVWTGRSLEEVSQHVGADSVVFDTQRLEAGVLVQGGAEGLYCEVAQLEISNTGGEGAEGGWQQSGPPRCQVKENALL